MNSGYKSFDTCVTNIFSYSVTCLCTFKMMSIDEQRFLILI